jgi:hypothetical protein
MKKQTFETRLPFPGFYCSSFSEQIDHEEDQQAEYLSEEHDISQDDAAQILNRHARYSRAFLEVAEKYTAELATWLEMDQGVDVKLEFVDMTSPKEYNFETDRIFANISRRDLAQLYRLAGRDRIAAKALEMFTSRSGFISFYSPDVRTWGPLSTWDHNQLYCIIRAIVDGTDAEEWCFYSMADANIFSDAYFNCVEWHQVNADIAELVAGKDVDDILPEFVFPPLLPVAEYVKQFNELNHLKD